MALIVIVGSVFLVFCLTDEKEEKAENYPRECCRLHRSATKSNLPDWKDIPTIPPIYIKV